MIEILDDGLLETLTPTYVVIIRFENYNYSYTTNNTYYLFSQIFRVLRDWPNTYVFTKAVAENYLQDVKNLPVAMVRPGIGINTKSKINRIEILRYILL